MKIIIATPEAVPFVKTGGLGDVAGALLKEFRRRDMDASLVLPLYKAIRKDLKLRRTGKTVSMKMGEQAVGGEIWATDGTDSPAAYFIECDELFGRDYLYGPPDGDYPDNSLRFAFFSRAVLELCMAMDIRPDVIHCNDWQTGLLPLYIKTLYGDYFGGTATLYTIHNLGYQGIFPAADMKSLGIGRNYFSPEGIEFYGKVNFMKAGLVYSDLINTVSVTYAGEILRKEYGFGLEGVLKMRKGDLCGITNGIDYDEWDPAGDALIPAKYGPDDPGPKEMCKKALLRETGLGNETAPLLGVVSRFTSQKGIDLISQAIAGGLVDLGVNIAVLGSGEPYYQDLLSGLAEKWKGRVFVKIGFDDRLARLIYAGADFFLMPSLYEPCGLSQLIALRYGTVPIVRKTGGLVDTVREYDHIAGKGTGFFFEDYTPSALLGAVKRALCVFVDKKGMGRAVRAGMMEDFSWEGPVDEYFRLYKRAMHKVNE